MTAAETGASLTTDCVDLVDEYDRRSDLLCLIEQVPDTACADTDVQLNEVGAGDGQELHSRLARNGLCKQGLAGTRRSYEQDALGNPCAHAGERLGVTEEVNDLTQLLLFLVGACDVLKGLFVLFLAAEPCASLAELANAVGAAAGAVHHDIPEQDDKSEGYHIGDYRQPPVGLRLGYFVIRNDASLVLLFYKLVKVLVEQREAVHLELDLMRAVALVVTDYHRNDVGAAVVFKGFDLFLFKQVVNLGVGDLFGLTAV